MTSILAFGDDRSAGAERCWDWISAHRWEGWSLEVITSKPSADLHPVPPEDAELHPWQPDDPRNGTGIGFESVQHLTAEVDPRVSLISKPWDLVAIGPRGSGADNDRFGSTAEWLLREPATPLVVANQPDRVRTALVATDGSEHAEKAVGALVSVPWIGDVSARVVTVVERRVDTGPVLEEATRRLLPVAARVESLVLDGPVTSALLEEIQRIEPDLVVMGVRGRGGFGRWIFGSTTSAVVKSIDRSILVAHAEVKAG